MSPSLIAACPTSSAADRRRGRSHPPDPEQLFDRFRLDVRVNVEVIAIDRDAHCVTTRQTSTGEERVIPYDKLVSVWGRPRCGRPSRVRQVRTLRTVEDAARLGIRCRCRPATAVVIGAGFIGLEIAENLVAQESTSPLSRRPPGTSPLDPNWPYWFATSSPRTVSTSRRAPHWPRSQTGMSHWPTAEYSWPTS